MLCKLSVDLHDNQERDLFLCCWFCWSLLDSVNSCVCLLVCLVNTVSICLCLLVCLGHSEYLSVL